MIKIDSTYRPVTLGYLGASFAPAYQIVMANEGGYVNNPADPGKETYAGISRRFWPNWSGWKIIDRIKAEENSTDDDGWFFEDWFSGWGLGALGINTNAKFPELDSHVYDFYLDLWASSKAGQIQDQQVANNYFDFFVLSSKAVLVLQRALNRIGKSVAEDNAIGPATLSAVNSADPEKLNSALVSERKKWHHEMVSSGKAPGVFLDNWLGRASEFGDDLITKMPWIAGAVTVATLGYIIYKTTQNNERKAKKISP